MIESNVVEWLDFGDSIQNIDVYSRKKLISLFRFFRILVKNKSFPIIIEIIFILILFIQLWTMAIMNVPSEGDIILVILNYLKKVTVFFEIITNSSNYKIIFYIVFSFIMLDIILMIIILFTNNKVNMSFLVFIINCLNLIINYYLVGPSIEVALTSVWCENNIHKYLQVVCYKNHMHLTFTILSILMLLLYIFVSFIYSFYCNEIELIMTNTKGNTLIRIDCKYETYCLVSKIIGFVLGFFEKKNEGQLTFKIIFQSYFIINSLIMSIYAYKYVYYYNNIINNIIHYGWCVSCCFNICILLKTLLKLKVVSNFIIFGYIIIIIAFYKADKMREYLLITEENIFEFKNIKSIETYKNILLHKLNKKNDNKSKVLIFGVIKKFEEFASNNPEINYQYQKLLEDKHLNKRFNKDDELPILSIIYILYSFYQEKFLFKEELILHMCYYLINKYNNVIYAMLLCSKLKAEGHRGLYYKFLLTEDIKEYLIFKINKKSNKENIKHIQIGSVILYYLYIELFKIKIYDATSNQIDYFDLIKNSVTTNKSTENFLKTGESILKSRNQIMAIWSKIIELNPFSDESLKDYKLYLDSILQDEFLSKEETQKYLTLKNKKSQEKFNVYHSMFLTDTSTILLIDGYLTIGKILYYSPNFAFLFMYNGKELLNFTIDDLLPNCIQVFHKELMEDAIKYSNINYSFKSPVDSLLKNRNEGLFNIKLYVKSVPNLSFGLIYFTYIQKIHDSNLIIVLDNDLKINGFTEMAQTGSPFTMSNGYNLTHGILGYHIGVIIPDILPLLEYKNNEFNIIKKDFELKGYLYPVEKTLEIKNKINIIFEKIKNNKVSLDDNQGQLENDLQNISTEFNDFIKELNSQNAKPFSIYYRVKLYTYLNGKYKYYRVYVNNNTLTINDFDLSSNFHKDILERKVENKKSLEFRNNLRKSKESKKTIRVMTCDKKSLTGKTNKSNNIENITLTKNSNNNKDNRKQTEVKKESNEDNDKNNALNQLNSISSNNSQANISMSGFNKIKNEVINKKEILPIKIMKYLCLIFGILTISFMIFDLMQQIKSYNRLSSFLKDNLFFNKTKIVVASLYTISVNIRYMSHSLFANSTSCLSGDWVEFYKKLLKENLRFLENQKNESSYLGSDLEQALYRKHTIELAVHRFEEKEIYEFNFDNIITFLINSIIKIIDRYDYYLENGCGEIIKELGLNETNLYNLIEQSYYLYISNISGFVGQEKRKRINKNFSQTQIPLISYAVFLLIFLLTYIRFILILHNIEIYFLEKIINFNSVNFDSYLKKLDEIKKKLRNDNGEEEDKADDMDFNYLDSKKKEEEEKEGNEPNEDHKSHEKGKHKKKKRHGNKQNKIQQQKKKKLSIMTSFFSTSNIFFIVKIIIVMLVSLSYYLLVVLMKAKYKNEYLTFDNINASIYGVFKDSYNIFLSLKRELDIYERHLLNCKTMGDINYDMRIPNISNVTIPKLGNLIMQITSSSNFDKNTLSKFTLLYSENACDALIESSSEIQYCEKFWSGVLLKGMEQAITQMGVVIGTVLDELVSLNDVETTKILYDLMDQSAFIIYEQFIEFYLLKAFNATTYIFNEFREQKINSIIKVMGYILWVYSFISIILFILLTFFIYSSQFTLNSFLNFIGIIPSQYLSEDENLFDEIIKFGKNYY